jgi:hypothetical protein
MNNILGAGNTVFDYLLVLLVYAFMYLLIRYPKPKLELNYKANFLFLSLFWAGLMFVGNYVGYLVGMMAFLPWLDNFLHSFLWVGICLTWLFYCTHERPMWEQFLLFAFVSFVVKVAEKLIIGTWSMDSYLGIKNPYAYIIAMSLIDGFYPLLSNLLIRALSRKSTFGVYAPQVV